MKILTAKELHLVIGKRLTIPEILDKFEMCSEEELFSTIRKIVPAGSAEFIRRIEKNNKKSHRKVAKANEHEVITSEEANVDEEVLTISQESEDDNSEERSNMPMNEWQQEIAKLEADEAFYSDSCCELEAKHKAMVGRRHEICKELAEGKAALDKLAKECERLEVNFKANVEEYHKVTAQMHSVNEELQLCSGILQEIRQKKEAMEKIHIFIYADGTIEVENAEIIAMEEEAVKAGVRCLSDVADDDFTLKQLKAIVKLSNMTNEYERSNRKYEIFFDGEKIQGLYEAVKNIL